DRRAGSRRLVSADRCRAKRPGSPGLFYVLKVLGGCEPMERVPIEGPLLGQSAACMPVLRALPRWFGIEDALLDYEREIDELPTFLTRRTGSEEVVGFVSVKR